MDVLRCIAAPFNEETLNAVDPPDAIALLSYLGGAQIARFPPRDRPAIVRALCAALSATFDADALADPVGSA